MADELINKIYDVSAIQKEADQIAAIVKSTTDLISQVRGMKDFAGLSDASKKLNDNMVAGKKAVEEYTAVEKELIAQKKQLETIEAKRYAVSSKNNQEIEKNKKLLAEQTQILKQKAIIEDKEAGTLEKLKASNILLNIEKNKLIKTDKDYEANLKRIIDLENENNEEIAKTKNSEQQRVAGIGEYKKQIGELSNAFLRGQLTSGQLVTGIKGIGKAIFSMPLIGWLAAAAAALVGVGSALIKNSVEFGKAASSLSAITGATGKDLDFLKKKAVEISRESTQSATDMLKAFQTIGGAMPALLKNGPLLAEVTKNAVTLAAASGGELSVTDAANAAAAALNQFNLPLTESARAINVLAAGSEAGSAEVQDITESMKNLGPVAASAGLSLENAVAGIEVLGEKGIKGAEAGTKLRGVILKLQDASLGYASGAFNLSDALSEINKAVSGKTSAMEKDAYIAKIFGAENITAGKIMMENVGKYESLTEAVTGTDTAFRQAAIQSDNLATSNKKFGNAWKNLMLSIEDGSGPLTKMWKGVVDFATQAINWIAGLKGEFIELYNKALPVRGLIEGLKMTFKNMFEVISMPFKELLNSLSGAGKILTAIVTGNLKEIPKIIGDTYEKAGTIAANTVKDIGNNVKTAWEQTRNGKIIVEESAKETVNVVKEKTKEELQLEQQLAAEKEELSKKEIARREKEAKDRIEAERRLTDSKLAIMVDGEEKQIAISNETFKRQLEDLKANGQLTAELKQNLEEAHQYDIAKIKDDFAKQTEEKRKADLDKAIADFEKNTQKEVDALSASYRIKETELKKQYASGLISKEDYENDLAKIQEEAAIEANAKTIERLQKELETSGLSVDKKAELSNKLRDLQLENENLVTDAVIKANEKQAASAKEKFEKIKGITENIANAGMELYSAIGDLEKQQSEERLAEIEERQKASDDYFAGLQKNLDNAAMSDGNRADTQKKIDKDKAESDKAISDKKKAEEIQAAKREKAQNLVSAIMSGALATLNGFRTEPFMPLGLIFGALAGSVAAVNIAKIASAKIPEYATGTMSTKNEFALWGEVRPEVAVTPRGDIMFAEKPTISKFDAGTRIFKSVEEFEKNISMTKGGDRFEIDYNKMGDSIASRMPGVNVNLDSRGLWGEVSKEGNRRTVINRRFKIGN